MVLAAASIAAAIGLCSDDKKEKLVEALDEWTATRERQAEEPQGS